MKKTLKILCFFGTRPEAIKMAPVVRELKKERRFRVVVAVSAQHRQMLDQVLSSFKLHSNCDLNLMKEGQSLFDLTARLLKSFERILDTIKPDMVLVHGDTTTTLGGSLACYYKKIPVGHVEAGLRTNDKYQPFPEEINRRLSDGIATLYFAPTAESRQNLRKENINAAHIFVTGNTVIDALLSTARNQAPYRNQKLARLVKALMAKRSPVVLMTAHRRENFGKPFADVCTAVHALAKRFPDVHWIYPVHPNPRVKGPAYRFLGKDPNVHLFEPLDYIDVVRLMNLCRIVVTDSGGLQEEAPALGKPVLVLRRVTERPEAVRAGTVRLVGTDRDKIVREVSRLLTDKASYRRMANAVNPYGDGRASERIRQAMRWYFKLTKVRPRPFGGGS